MTLQSVAGISQSAVGKKEHWHLFEQFQGSDLHAAIVAGLHGYLERHEIDSSIAGSEILERIESASPYLLDEYSQDISGGLFGMTLWNLLAKHSARWCFVPKKADPLDDVTGTFYFRVPA